MVKTEVSVAKNYLAETELESSGRIVNAYLDLAEERAKRHIPMTVEDWANVWISFRKQSAGYFAG